MNRMVLAKRLKLDGHIVVATVNGQEGLDKVIEDRQFDCILMDIMMPILDGWESTAKIREVEALSPPVKDGEDQRLTHQMNGRIPIFAVSASLLEKNREKLISCGMDGWILKPIDYKRLSVILRGVKDSVQRSCDLYYPGCSWERGGWLSKSGSESPQRVD